MLSDTAIRRHGGRGDGRWGDSARRRYGDAAKNDGQRSFRIPDRVPVEALAAARILERLSARILEAAFSAFNDSRSEISDKVKHG